MSDPLTPVELAIANGTASAELCCEMIHVLCDRIAAHAMIVEASGDCFSIITVRALLADAEFMLAKARIYAGGAVVSEMRVRNADAPTH